MSNRLTRGETVALLDLVKGQVIETMNDTTLSDDDRYEATVLWGGVASKLTSYFPTLAEYGKMTESTDEVANVGNYFDAPVSYNSDETIEDAVAELTVGTSVTGTVVLSDGSTSDGWPIVRFSGSSSELAVVKKRLG